MKNKECECRRKEIATMGRIHDIEKLKIKTDKNTPEN